MLEGFLSISSDKNPPISLQDHVGLCSKEGRLSGATLRAEDGSPLITRDHLQSSTIPVAFRTTKPKTQSARCPPGGLYSGQATLWWRASAAPSHSAIRLARAPSVESAQVSRQNSLEYFTRRASIGQTLAPKGQYISDLKANFRSTKSTEFAQPSKRSRAPRRRKSK